MQKLRKAQQLMRERAYPFAIPYFMGALDDYDNMEEVMMEAWRCPNSEIAFQLLDEVEMSAGVRLMMVLGPNCFEETFSAYGDFGELPIAHHYMNVLGTIARMAYDHGKLDKAIAVSIKALRLSQADSIGQRSLFTTILLEAGRISDALSFCQVWLDPQYYGKKRPLGGCEFKPPRTDPLTAQEIEVIKNERPNINLLLDGAYAAFRIWGDCELARQYLSLGTHRNPIIFSKILAKKGNPPGPKAYANERPTQLEEAHNYRWQAQQLWVAEDAWNWISTNHDVQAAVLKTCSRGPCDQQESVPLQFKRCKGCKRTFYCGRDCQKMDWGWHRLVCNEKRILITAPEPRADGAPSPLNSLSARDGVYHVMKPEGAPPSHFLKEFGVYF
ncbi:hypothetical protein C8Q79DRAFT_364734 [Trametes meyenii]|nr:hypothetical protein C8Q79DRAFT_364734 [Trametes meyenii]